MLMLCLHLSFYQDKKLLRSSYLTLVHWYIGTLFTLAQITQVDLSALALLHYQCHCEIELAGNSKTMLASRSKVVAFVAIAFYMYFLTG